MKHDRMQMFCFQTLALPKASNLPNPRHGNSSRRDGSVLASFWLLLLLLLLLWLLLWLLVFGMGCLIVSLTSSRHSFFFSFSDCSVAFSFSEQSTEQCGALESIFYIFHQLNRSWLSFFIFRFYSNSFHVRLGG